MADFRIKAQKADVIQNADLIQNHNPVVQHTEIEAQVLLAQLRDLLGRIDRSIDTAELERAAGERLKAVLEAAARETTARAPRRSRIVAALNQARHLTTGLATPSIIEATDGVVTTLSR
jgi:hypothetical protein